MISSKTMIPAAVLLCASSGAMAADPATPTEESTGTLPGFTQLDVDLKPLCFWSSSLRWTANADGWISMPEYTAFEAGS
ncbi:MAG: hypothetical protein ACREYF_18505 [Gammaproteobacteria bacterium]